MNAEIQWIITALFVPTVIWLAKTGHDLQQSFISYLTLEANRADIERRETRDTLNRMQHSLEDISEWFQTHYVVPDGCPFLAEAKDKITTLARK